MGSEINNKINEFLCNPKIVKKRGNTRLKKCYGFVNIATAEQETKMRGKLTSEVVDIIFCLCASEWQQNVVRASPVNKNFDAIRRRRR